MKRNLPLLLVAFAAGNAIAADPPAVTVFKDANLQATVRKFLPDAKPDEPLTDARLESLQIVTASTPIADLSGLEKCKKLTYVFVTGGVSDLSPLKGLTNLQTLTVKGGKVKDLTPLAGLTKLEYLDLSDNQISDLAPLANLKALTSLAISNNRIEDLTPLQSLTALQTLHADGNQIANLKPLANLKTLVSIDLNKNKVSDPSPLSSLTRWRDVHLDQDQITDLASLIEMASSTAKAPEAFGIARTMSLSGDPLSANAKSRQVPELRKLLFDLVADK